MPTMQAAILYAPGDLRIEKVPVPGVGRNDVLVRVRAVGICGSDLHLYNNCNYRDLLKFYNLTSEDIEAACRKVLGHK